MVISTPKTLALDFDGGICDGLIEYFQTAWRAYQELFDIKAANPPAGLAERFYPLRPVIESGWEMPVLLHALQSGYGNGDVLRNWNAIAHDLISEANLEPGQVATVVDTVRDQWIRADLDSWLAQHRFYPGIIERIKQAQQSGVEIIIISTKEGRFIHQLLSQAELFITQAQIYGKEVGRPKYQTLQILQSKLPQPIWFIEDRIKALASVKERKELEEIMLFLADWGYNTATDRQDALNDPRLQLLELSTFTHSFPEWIPSTGI